MNLVVNFAARDYQVGTTTCAIDNRDRPDSLAGSVETINISREWTQIGLLSSLTRADS